MMERGGQRYGKGDGEGEGVKREEKNKQHITSHMTYT